MVLDTTNVDRSVDASQTTVNKLLIKEIFSGNDDKSEMWFRTSEIHFMSLKLSKLVEN
jgi:hypothetical protein